MAKEIFVSLRFEVFLAVKIHMILFVLISVWEEHAVPNTSALKVRAVLYIPLKCQQLPTRLHDVNPETMI